MNKWLENKRYAAIGKIGPMVVIYFKIFALLLCSSIKMIGQQKSIISLTKFSTENGLPANFVKSIVKDSTGLIWIATEKGLCTFNEKEFKPLNLGKLNERIEEIYIDKYDLIWIKYDKTSYIENIPSIEIFNPHSKSFHPLTDVYHFDEKLFTSNHTHRIWSLRDRDIALSNSQNKKFVTSGDSIKYISSISEHNIDKSNLFNDIIILQPNNHNIIDCNNNVVNDRESLNVKLNVSSLNYQFSLFFQSDGPKHEEHFLNLDYKFHPQQKKYFDYPNLYLFRSNNLTKYNIETREVINYKNELLEIGSNIHITSILEYKNDILLGTNKGLLIIHEFPNYFNSMLSNEYISTRNIVQIGEDSLLVATFQGLYLLDVANNNETLIAKQLHGYGITKYDNCNYIIGTYGSRYLKVNICGKETKVSSIETPYTFHKLYSKDLPYVASTSGLLYYDVETNNTDFQIFENGVFKGNVVDFYTVQEDSIIWALTTTGILEINVAFNSFKRLPEINDYHIKCVFMTENSTSEYLIGTHRNGILKYDTESGIKKNYREKNGLSNNNIHSILTDSLERIWVSTNDGVNIFYEDSEEFIPIYKNLGFKTDEFNSFSSLKMSDGKFVLGSIDGITIFNPLDINFGASSKQIELNKLILTDDQGIETIHIIKDGLNNISIKNPKHEAKIELLASNNSTNYSKYRYLIPGIANEWIYPPNNFIRLPNLSYGNFEILISRKDELNSWSSPQKFQIHVPKPIYKVIWFYVFLAAILLFGIIYILNYLRRRTELRNRKIEKEIELKTQQLSETNASLKSINEFNETLFAILGHDLRSPLMAFNNTSQKLNYLKQKKDDKGIIKLIKSLESQSHELLDEIENLLSWAVLQRKSNAPVITEFNLNQTIHEVIDAHQNLIENKAINLKLKLSADNCLSDSEAIKVIFRNIFNNALKFTPEGSKVVVRSGKDKNSRTFFEVQDSGMGIPKKLINSIISGKRLTIKQDNKSRGNGLGLIISVTLLKRIKSSIEITNAESKGTKIRVTI